MRRLTLRYLATQLSYQDVRAVKAWCKRRGITPFRDGSRLYVFEDEFNKAIQKEGFKKSNILAVPKIKIESYKPSPETTIGLNRAFARIIASSICEEQANGTLHIL